MHCTFRWYDDKDPVPLQHIRQIPGVRGIVAALYDTPPGVDWDEDALKALRDRIERAGLEFRVVESIPVHESVKLGTEGSREATASWIRSLRAVAKVLGPASKPTGSTAPVVVTYNFMPVFDWTRTELARVLPDGSTALAYDAAAIARMDPLEGELSLPGWLARYSREEMYKLLEAYRSTEAERVYAKLVSFLREVTPVAEDLGVRLALHPDDPPWPIFGIPRVITGSGALRRLFADVPSPANGLCLCTGSFGSSAENDPVAMAREFAGRTAFAHLRNVKLHSDGSFEESAHWVGAGSIDLPGVVRELLDAGYEGPVRPDHGRMIWGEKGRPGYGLYDRALGAMYVQGLIDARVS